MKTIEILTKQIEDAAKLIKELEAEREELRTKVMPTKPGWYFVKFHKDAPWTITEVFFLAGHLVFQKLVIEGHNSIGKTTVSFQETHVSFAFQWGKRIDDLDEMRRQDAAE